MMVLRIGGSSAAAHVLAVAVVGMTAVWSTAYGQADKPMNLRSEYRVNPLGIDVAAPRLSWEVNDRRRGAVQTAYQVVVGTEPALKDTAAVVWDTGKVESDRSVQVPYAGRSLTSGQQYYWQVRTWDAEGQASPYSDPAWWETGLLSAEDWSARWIIGDKPAEVESPIPFGDWIWDSRATGDKGVAFMRRSFKIDPAEKVAGAELRISVDDVHALFLNGRKVCEHAGWNVVRRVEVGDLIKSGANVLAVRGTNAAGPCGLNFSMRIQFDSGKTLDILSDDQWRSHDEGVAGWTSVGFDDSRWAKAAVVAKHGAEPWGKLKEPAKPRRALCLRKGFELKGEVVRARAYACGLGIYELRLNGRKVGQDIFTPGWTHYYKRLQYQTYDVTELLREGENAVGMTLGNGWWSGGLGWKSADQYSEGDLRAILQLNVEYADGTSEAIVTDPSWRAGHSPITRNTYYHGETHDARLAMPGWDGPGFDDSDWWPTKVTENDVPLVAQRCQTIQVTEELTDPQISEPEKGVYIFDFRQNSSGRVRLTVKDAQPGTKIRLRFGEELDPNGRLYRENYRSAEATDEYICRGGGEEIWEPIFTYRGFRYCEVTGLPKPPDGNTLSARVLHTAAPAAGTFECSHWLLNRIYRNVSWGFRSNIHSVPTDCPQRDERLGWMGDAQAFAHTSCFLRDVASFYSKWMFDVADSQSPEGAVTDVSPAKVVKGAAKPGWGDAVVIMPYTVWRFYGDTRVIEENYDAMVGWVEYMRSQSKDHLYEQAGYGDWVPVVKSPTEWIGSAFYYYSTKLLSEMAAAIGKIEDSRKYAALAEKIAAAFNAKHLDKATNSYLTGTQTCNILPLAFGITPGDRRAPVLENLVRDIRERGDHLSTGFMGTTYLTSLLADEGQQDLAYLLATQTTYPSWGYMVLQGATTIWERWDTDKQGPGMNSRNHFAFGTVVRWFFEDVAGINLDPTVPGFKRIVIRPRPTGDLSWARAEYPSMYGWIVSSWRKTENGLILDVLIPANTTAEVHVPTWGLSANAVKLADDTIFARDRASGKMPEHVKFISSDHDAIVFEVGAGSYSFEMTGHVAP